MNVMAEAHKLARTVMQNAPSEGKGVYAYVLKHALIHFHKEYKAMQKQSKQISTKSGLVKGYMVEGNLGNVPFVLGKPMQMWETLYAVTTDGEVYETTVDTTKRPNHAFDKEGRVWTQSSVTAAEAVKFEFIGNYKVPQIVK